MEIGGDVTYLGINAPRQFGLDHHDDDAKHPKNQRVVAEPFPFLEQGSPAAQLVAHVLVFSLVGFGVAAAAPVVGGGGALGDGTGGIRAAASAAPGPAGVILTIVALTGVEDRTELLFGRDDDLGGVAAPSSPHPGAQRLHGLRFWLGFDEVSPGGTESAERLHHPSAVLARTHGYLREGVTVPPLDLGAGLPVFARSAAATAAYPSNPTPYPSSPAQPLSSPRGRGQAGRVMMRRVVQLEVAQVLLAPGPAGQRVERVLRTEARGVEQRELERVRDPE